MGFDNYLTYINKCHLYYINNNTFFSHGNIDDKLLEKIEDIYLHNTPPFGVVQQLYMTYNGLNSHFSHRREKIWHQKRNLQINF